MKQKRHKPEEIIRLLRHCDSSDLNQEAFCRQKQISIDTLHRCRKKYGQVDETDSKGLTSRLVTFRAAHGGRYHERSRMKRVVWKQPLHDERIKSVIFK